MKYYIILFSAILISCTSSQLRDKNTLSDCTSECDKDYLECLSDYGNYRDCINEKYVCLDLCNLHYGL